MKHCKWGIEGYLVIYGEKVIGQFDNAGWAMEFQKIVSHLKTGRPVTILSDDCNSTMITDEKEEPTSNQSNDESSTRD